MLNVISYYVQLGKDLAEALFYRYSLIDIQTSRGIDIGEADPTGIFQVEDMDSGTHKVRIELDDDANKSGRSNAYSRTE